MWKKKERERKDSRFRFSQSRYRFQHRYSLCYPKQIPEYSSATSSSENDKTTTKFITKCGDQNDQIEIPQGQQVHLFYFRSLQSLGHILILSDPYRLFAL